MENVISPIGLQHIILCVFVHIEKRRSNNCCRLYNIHHPVVYGKIIIKGLSTKTMKHTDEEEEEAPATLQLSFREFLAGPVRRKRTETKSL